MYADLSDKQKLLCGTSVREVHKLEDSLQAVENERDAALAHCRRLEELLGRAENQLKVSQAQCDVLQEVRMYLCTADAHSIIVFCSFLQYFVYNSFERTWTHWSRVKPRGSSCLRKLRSCWNESMSRACSSQNKISRMLCFVKKRCQPQTSWRLPKKKQVTLSKSTYVQYVRTCIHTYICMCIEFMHSLLSYTNIRIYLCLMQVEISL